MKTFGLTGGIGMGKSTAAQLLRARGVAVVDTDDLARQVVAPGQPAWREVQEVFGKSIVSPDGQLRRDELARLVFSDPVARQKLEDILHPRIQELWSAQLTTWRDEGRALAVVVIPLLYETQAEAHFDAVICVACTAVTQQQRLLARGWTAAESAQRVAAQWPVAQKMAQADYVVWTEAGTDVHAQQLGRIIGISANEK
jgi:dephospho-CoA kinase